MQCCETEVIRVSNDAEVDILRKIYPIWKCDDIDYEDPYDDDPDCHSGWADTWSQKVSDVVIPEGTVWQIGGAEVDAREYLGAWRRELEAAQQTTQPAVHEVPDDGCQIFGHVVGMMRHPFGFAWGLMGKDGGIIRYGEGASLEQILVMRLASERLAQMMTAAKVP